MTLISENEINFIKNNLPKDDKSVVFSHNDLLANNVLICEPGNEIKFIDFEYSGYNFRTYDIGNYFAESQFDYNVTEPPFFAVEDKELDEEKIEDFIRYYALASLFPENKFD